jgi:hypothetical protein
MTVSAYRGFVQAAQRLASAALLVFLCATCAPAQSGSNQGGSNPAPPPASTPQSQSGDNGPSTDTSAAPTGAPASKSKSQAAAAPDDGTTKVRLRVTNNQDKGVPNASVYVRFNESGGLFHKDHLSEMNFKTNDDGSVKIPEVPIGKVLIQIVAKGYHTYGKWYDIGKDPDPILIKLDPPPHWY